MIRVNSMKTALLISLMSQGAIAAPSPIPGVDEGYFQGENTYANLEPDIACKVFNDKVALINASINQNYPELAGQMQVSNNLCQHIRINDIQFETTFETDITSNNLLPSMQTCFSPLCKKTTNTYDLARVTDILIFSGTDRTDYVMFVNGDINFATQEFNNKVYQSDEVLPMALTGFPDKLHGATGFFHDTSITNTVVDGAFRDSIIINDN